MSSVVDELEPVPPDVRAELRTRLGETGAHERAMASIRSLHEVRLSSPPGGGGSGTPTVLGERIRVVAWNVERGRHVDAIAETLVRTDVDLALLTELDVGMVRSGNVDTVSEIAAALGQGAAFGVEFVELGFGNVAETAAAPPGAVNAQAFHGNAVLAAAPIESASLIRIEADGAWFAAGSAEPRVGGRLAIAAQVPTVAGPLIAASVHLESESGPDLRARQLATVLDAVDDAFGAGPAVVGGDLNTFSCSQEELLTPDLHRSRTEEDPDRWWWPVPHEPLFDVAADHGFDARAANRAVPTVRLAADQASVGLPRLDWILTRGLVVHEASTIPAVGDDGTVLSDHDAVLATVSLP